MRLYPISRRTQLNTIRFLVPLVTLFVGFPQPVLAQSSGSAQITPPETSSYPIFSTYLVVYDSQGNFIHNLSPSQVQLFEDGNPLEIVGMQEQRPGAQIAVVINPGPSFAIQNSQAVSRYDFVIDALTVWGNSRMGTNIDDMSLLTTAGASSNHAVNPADWVTVLTSGKVDARSAEPNLDTLLQAQNIVTDAGLRSTMGRSILLITAPIEGLPDETFENIVSQARQNNIRVNVWMVSSPGTYSAQAADQLVELAAGTGGSFFEYSGEGDLPDPDIYFEPLRSVYMLEYESNLKTSGTHQLQAQVETNTEPVSTNPQLFEFEILAPAPTLVSPPVIITRAPLDSQKIQLAAEFSLSDLSPKEQVISAVIQFPDGRVRDIVRSSLYADGEIVAQNSNPPFDQFTWNIEKYNQSGTHSIFVEVEDVFGIQGRSTQIPVEIRMEIPAPSPLAVVYKNIPIIAALAAIVGGSILVLVLILAGKIQPRLPGKSSRWRRAKDRIPQPVHEKVYDEKKRRTLWVGSQIPENACALLIPLSEQLSEISLSSISLEEGEITFGNDPNLADITFDDPALQAVHSRLSCLSKSEFRLNDQGTVAGTWVNYTPVSEDGCLLNNGDLVHIGRIGFRFALNDPARKLVPVIEKVPEERLAGFNDS